MGGGASLNPPRGACVILGACILAHGCAAPGDRNRDDTTLSVAYCCGREALSPGPEVSARYLVFLPLVENDGGGARRPRLARRWEHSVDYRTTTYHLRSDVRWNDGVPVTAQDVEFTLDLLSHPAVRYFAPGDLSVTMHDDSTVAVSGASWFVDGGDWWNVIWPKHVLAGLDPARFYEWDFWTRPVGNGPYRVARYVPETLMELEASPTYYGSRPRIEKVVLKFTGNAALAELLSGGVDAITENDPARILKLGADPRFRVHHAGAETVSRALYWNRNATVLRDPRVRRALTLAIDRRELLRTLNLPDTLPLADGPYTGWQFLRRDLPEPLPHHPAGAGALLDEAGWRDHDGDGIRDRDGQSLGFTAIAMADAALEPGGLGLATQVQAQLRRVGVRMDIRPLEPGLVYERLNSGAFEAAFTVFQHQAWWLARFLGPAGYWTPAVERLVTAARTTSHPDTLDAYYTQLMDLFRRELPATFLGPRTETYIVHRRVRGLEGRRWPDPVLHAEHLWLERKVEVP